MENLLAIDWEKEYLTYVESLEFTDIILKKDFLNLLKSKNPLERENLWSNIRIKFDSIKEIWKLANPFFIGFGNPNSDILFLGREKGFDINNSPNLFIKESINNIVHWNLINKNHEQINHNLLIEKIGFNPLFPRTFHNGQMRKSHTWGKYSHIVGGLRNKDHGKIFNEIETYEKSFFYDCFISEINFIPSRYSKGTKLNNVRKKLLKHDFYKSFSKIIIGALGYLSIEDIMELFSLKGSGFEIELGENKSRKIKAHKFQENGKIIIYCNQLSGASGWTNEALSRLIQELK